MIKYLGSKRALVQVIGRIATAVAARTAVDLFTGTTRVAQELKRRGLHVTACDLASYSAVLSDCYVATDATRVDAGALGRELARLDALPGYDGYVTRTFCEQSRYFQPHNGRRIDAIRDAVEERRGDDLYPLLLTSLLLAADRVDSTTGLQMAYLKQWAPRSARDLRLSPPALLPGPGTTVLGDVMLTVDTLAEADLAYLDPPYNHHRYFTNYHVWETLVRWDAPEHYGVACKRVDARDEATRSVFNAKASMPSALATLLGRVRARTVLLSYNDESWLTAEELVGLLRASGRETVATLSFPSPRYVGARIGIYNGAGEKVGAPGRLRNTEHIFVAGDKDLVAAAVAAVGEPETGATDLHPGTPGPQA